VQNHSELHKATKQIKKGVNVEVLVDKTARTSISQHWKHDKEVGIHSKPVVLNLGFSSTGGAVNNFGRVASRYFMYTAVIHFVCSSFRWGSLDYSGFLYWDTVQKVWNHCLMFLSLFISLFSMFSQKHVLDTVFWLNVTPTAIRFKHVFFD